MKIFEWFKILISGKPHLTIKRDEGIYLKRWFIIPRNKWFNVYLHNFLGSDIAEATHNHPWHSLGLTLKGKYKEITPEGEEIFRLFKIKYRGPNYFHRIELIDKSVWTLFITGPVVQDWGFLCPNGFRYHDHVILKQTNNIHEGIMCPE